LNFFILKNSCEKGPHIKTFSEVDVNRCKLCTIPTW